MTIAFAQSATNSANNTATVSASITSTGGNTLIVTGRWFDGNATLQGPSAVADSASNTWHFSSTQTANPPSEFGPANFGSFAAWSISASAVTSVSVTVPFTGSGFQEFVVSEWSGIASETTGGIQVDASGATVPFTATLTVPSGGLMVAASDQLTTPTGAPTGTTALTAVSGAAYFVYQLTSGSTAFTWPGGGTGFTSAAAAFSPASAVLGPGAALPQCAVMRTETVPGRGSSRIIRR